MIYFILVVFFLDKVVVDPDSTYVVTVSNLPKPNLQTPVTISTKRFMFQVSDKLNKIHCSNIPHDKLYQNDTSVSICKPQVVTIL